MKKASSVAETVESTPTPVKTPKRAASTPKKTAASTNDKKMDISDDEIVIEVTRNVKKTGTPKPTAASSNVDVMDSDTPKAAKRTAKATSKASTTSKSATEGSKSTKNLELDSEAPSKPRGRSIKATTIELEPVVAKKTAKRASAKKSAGKEQIDDIVISVPIAKRSKAAKVYSDEMELLDAPKKKRGRAKMTPPAEEVEVIDLTQEPVLKKKAKVTSSRKKLDAGEEIHSLQVEESKVKSSLKKSAAATTKEHADSNGDDFIINDQLIQHISSEMRLHTQPVLDTLQLLKEGNTVPFITRYRKELIDSMDENGVRAIQKMAIQYTALYHRKQTVLETIKSLNKLTPELEAAIHATLNMRSLEDIYAPYRPKKNSLADIAIAKGLGDLSETLLQRPYSDPELTSLLSKHINKEKDLHSLQDVMLGVQHIWAEKVSDSANVRNAVRPIYAEFGTISTSPTAKIEEEMKAAKKNNDTSKSAHPSRKRAQTYSYYYEFIKPVPFLKSHNVMAINRGEKEKFLKVKFSAPEPDLLAAASVAFSRDHTSISGLIELIVAHFALLQPEQTATQSSSSTASNNTANASRGSKTGASIMSDLVHNTNKPKKPKLDEDDDEDFLPAATSQAELSSDNHHNTSSYGGSIAYAGSQTIHATLLRDAIVDGFKRLLHPSMVNEVRNMLTETAESDSIATFGRNLKSLLLRPPVSGHIILGIDPGFSHGCKTCIIDENGKVLDTRVIFPLVGESRRLERLRQFDQLIRHFGVTLVAIGNGTAYRETADFVKQYKKEANNDLLWCVVSESGASVYSVSAEAQAEFPHLDPAGRGAASIARRTLDPMAEIVKIPTQSIGVGSYQHDVNQKELERSLSSVVEDCVNYVGVNLNTASQPLLRRVSGLTSNQAQNIVAFRETNGGFDSRTQLLKVKGIGPKTYTQCAGFLRLPGSSEPLDNTGIHPESYPHANQLLKSLKFTSKDINHPTKKSKVREALEKLDAPALAEKLKVGLPTLADIITDLKKPGRDPRATAQIVQIDNQVSSLDDLQVGMSLMGRITNVTGFGAFVDVGIGQEGLVAPKEIIDPKTNLFSPEGLNMVHPGFVSEFVVIDIDNARNRLSLRLVLPLQGSPVLM